MAALSENFPRLGKDEDLIPKQDFHFSEDFYKKFNDFVGDHPGRTTKECVEMIDFYDFNEESLDVAFRLFNTWKNTYYNVCGPFLNRD